MLMEAITISSILGASAFAVWFAKARFQPEIERSLTKIEAAVAAKDADAKPVEKAVAAKEETIVTKQRLSNETG